MALFLGGCSTSPIWLCKLIHKKSLYSLNSITCKEIRLDFVSNVYDGYGYRAARALIQVSTSLQAKRLLDYTHNHNDILLH